MLHRVFGVLRPDGRPGHGAAHRDGGAAASTRRSSRSPRSLARGGHARLPVYRKSLDDIVGMLHVTDLFQLVAGGKTPADLTGVVREAFTVPETMPADDLLSEMRTRQTPGGHRDRRVRRHGGPGDVRGPDGTHRRRGGPWRRENRITVLADGSALIDGLALVADVNVQFGLHIDEEAYNTLGGYVLGRLGRRARVGDRFDVESRTLRVEALDGLRVARVFLSKEKDVEQNARNESP